MHHEILGRYTVDMSINDRFIVHYIHILMLKISLRQDVNIMLRAGDVQQEIDSHSKWLLADEPSELQRSQIQPIVA